MRPKLIRLLLLISILSGFYLIGKISGFNDWFNLENVRLYIDKLGFWGYLIFAPLLVIGSFIHIPVFLFVVAAIMTYGQVEGTILGFAGVLFASICNFYFVRFFGGKPLEEIRSPFLNKILQNLHTKPLQTMFVLRFFMWGSPLLNFTLGLTKIRSVHFIVGSALGLVIPFMIFSFAIHFFKEVVFSYV